MYRLGLSPLQWAAVAPVMTMGCGLIFTLRDSELSRTTRIEGNQLVIDERHLRGGWSHNFFGRQFVYFGLDQACRKHVPLAFWP